MLGVGGRAGSGEVSSGGFVPTVKDRGCLMSANEWLESVVGAAIKGNPWCDECGGVLPEHYDEVEGIYLHYVDREPEACGCEWERGTVGYRYPRRAGK